MKVLTSLSKSVYVVPLSISVSLASMLSSCSGAQMSANSEAASATTVLSSTDLFQSLTAAPASQRLAALSAISHWSLTTYYATLLRLASPQAVTIDGHRYLPLRQSLLAQAASYRQLGAEFASVGALWQALGISPQTMTLATLQHDLAAIRGAEPQALDLLPGTTYDFATDNIGCQGFAGHWNLDANALAETLSEATADGPGIVIQEPITDTKLVLGNTTTSKDGDHVIFDPVNTRIFEQTKQGSLKEIPGSMLFLNTCLPPEKNPQAS